MASREHGEAVTKDAYIGINVHYQASGSLKPIVPGWDSIWPGIPVEPGDPERRGRSNPAGFREIAGRQTPAGRIPNIPPFAANFRITGSTLFTRPATH